MRRRVSKYTSALITLAVATTWAAGTVTGSAAEPADNVFIRQAGNGSGVSEPVIEDFSLGTVLFSNVRFQVCDPPYCVQRPIAKYVAWGAIETTDATGAEVTQLAMATGGDDGLRWSSPSAATLKDSDNNVGPFLLNGNGQFFDVVFTGAQQTPFEIFYRTGTDEELSDISSIHRATSVDGVAWTDDKSITQTTTNLIEPGTFKAQSYGPTDVIFQPSGSSSCTTASPYSPWSCKYVMLYDATGPTDDHPEWAQSVGIAGSDNGTAFRGMDSYILTAGAAGSWDEQAATLAHARVLGAGKVELYYSGGMRPASTCMHGDSVNGRAGCFSIGTAYGDGLVFTKNASNPVTPSALLDAFSKNAPTTIWNPQVVDAGTNPSKVYFTRITDKLDTDVFLAYTAPAPAQSPEIALSSPSGAYARNESIPVVAFLSDTLGSTAAKIGLDMSTLAITLDGQTLGGYIAESSIVTAYDRPAERITIAADQIRVGTGIHTLKVRVSDRDGNTTTLTRQFEIDETAPVTQMTGKPDPASPQFGFPDSIGTFSGTTVEGADTTGTSLIRLRAIVVDPLGQVKTYETPRATGFPVDKASAKTWNWTFVAPTLDPFFVVPGNYTVSVVGIDAAGNVEPVSPANTATVLVL
ncbi:MAG: hypothetical protein WDA27_03325 [Actinomycetota bacterium]